MSRAHLLFASVTLGSVVSIATLAACGGNVVFVEDGDGSGGNGASGPTTSGPTTSGPTTSGPSSSISTTTVGPSSVSVTTGSGTFCDTGEQTSIDSFQCSNCVECAQGEPCGFTIEACYNDPDCSAFLDCLQNCMDDMCSQQCADQNPNGVQGYYAIIDCLVCSACPNNCDALNNCPFQ